MSEIPRKIFGALEHRNFCQVPHAATKRHYSSASIQNCSTILPCNRDVVYVDASMRSRAGSIGYVNDCPDESAVPVRSISGRCPDKAQAENPGAELTAPAAGPPVAGRSIYWGRDGQGDGDEEVFRIPSFLPGEPQSPGGQGAFRVSQQSWPRGWRSRPSAPATGSHMARGPVPSGAREPHPCRPGRRRTR